MRPKTFNRWILPALVLLFGGLYYLGSFTPTYWPPTVAADLRAVDTTRISAADWSRIQTGLLRGTAVALPLKNGTVVTERATVARPPLPAAIVVLDAALSTFALLLAGYLGHRRPSIMVAAFAAFVIGVCSITGIYAWLSLLPHWALTLISIVPISLCAIFPNFALASFAIRFPGSSPSPARRTAIRIVDSIVLLALLVELIHNSGSALFEASTTTAYYTAALSAAALLTLIASLYSLRFAKPSERTRVGIVFAAIMVGGVGYALTGVFQNQIGFTIFRGSLLYDSSVVIVALAVAYAILKHRVFDVAFVLNRTLVYAATSSIALLIFAALEFALERFLSSLSHVEDVLIEFGIAMFVILSGRIAHGYADRFIDVVVFRKRHEDEQALRRFAHEAAYITDRETLLQRATEILEERADAAFATVTLLGDIDQNDPAVVGLRAWHKPLDLSAVRTRLHGDWAYPLVARGRVLGALVLGPKRSGETYAPDESDAIGQIAQSVAGSLDIMEAQSDSALARIENLLETLPERLAEQLRSLEAH